MIILKLKNNLKLLEYVFINYLILTLNWPWIFTSIRWLGIISIRFILRILVCHHIGHDLRKIDHSSIVLDKIIAFYQC